MFGRCILCCLVFCVRLLLNWWSFVGSVVEMRFCMRGVWVLEYCFLVGVE